MRITEDLVIGNIKTRIIFNKSEEEIKFIYCDVKKSDYNVLGQQVKRIEDFLSPSKVKNTRFTKLFHFIKFLYILSQYAEKNNLSEISASNLMTGLYTGASISSITSYKKQLTNLGLIKYSLRTYFSKKKKFSSQPHQITVYEFIDVEGLKKYSIDHFHIDLKETTDLDDYVKLQDVKTSFYSAVLDYAAKRGDKDSKKIRKREKNAEKRKARELKKLCNENKDFLVIKDNLDNYGLSFRYLDTGSKRFNNPICSTRNENHENSTRLDDIRKLFCSNKNIVEFDTNASIYRLSYSLGQQQPLAHDKDIYKTIFDSCNFASNIEFNSIRKQFKKLMMTIYMREHGINYTCMRYDYLSKQKFIGKKNQEFVDFYKELLTKLKCSILTLLNRVRDAMHKFFNLTKFYMANIFIHESNLHLLMLKKFQELNIKAINVYDGFYFEEGTMTQELYDEIYDSCTLELIGMMA